MHNLRWTTPGAIVAQPRPHATDELAEEGVPARGWWMVFPHPTWVNAVGAPDLVPGPASTYRAKPVYGDYLEQ